VLQFRYAKLCVGPLYRRRPTIEWIYMPHIIRLRKYTQLTIHYQKVQDFTRIGLVTYRTLTINQQKNWANYCGGEKILSPQRFQHCGGEASAKRTAQDWNLRFVIRNK